MRIDAWWTADGNANIGIATGVASDLLVLDIDPRNQGVATLRRLEADLGPLPETVESVTGSGGAHLFFRALRGVSVRGQLGAGVDVKFAGGYVVAPPSRHANGHAYAWRGGRASSEKPLATLPEAWVNALTRTAATTPRFSCSPSSSSTSLSHRERRARRYARKISPAVSGQQGHTTTFRAAIIVTIGFDLDAETAFRVLREEWNASCVPPWSARELRRKINEALTHSTALPGFLLDRFGERR
jgi:hypothetical protein